mmetsp:Transcript_20495/g.31234  ORF Transcript_20495/g.31234 Transcript_20495/m.31234 type:complete len:85 (+) Transcript_20495:947-1201(+)
MVVIVHCHHFHFVRTNGSCSLKAGGGKVCACGRDKEFVCGDTNESLQGESHRTLKFYSRSSGVSNDLSLLMSINTVCVDGDLGL